MPALLAMLSFLLAAPFVLGELSVQQPDQSMLGVVVPARNHFAAAGMFSLCTLAPAMPAQPMRLQLPTTM